MKKVYFENGWDENTFELYILQYFLIFLVSNYFELHLKKFTHGTSYPLFSGKKKKIERSIMLTVWFKEGISANLSFKTFASNSNVLQM